jgi:L-aspartate oxidase
MPAYDPRAELAPRDVVTRGIFAAMQRAGGDHVLLDLTHLSADYLQRRFPTIYTRCCAEGFDLAVEPVPVAPAAHYLMGGIRTDLDGATSLPGLYAAGECACTGVHGANRLASNSLLECLVFGRRAAEAALNAGEPIRGFADARRPDAWYYPVTATPPPRSIPAPHASRRALAQIMRSHASPLRSGASLEEALRRLAAFPDQATSRDAQALTLTNAALTARLIVTSALLREESRGAHFRTDFPTTQPEWQVHTILSRGQEPFTVATVAAMELELALA